MANNTDNEIVAGMEIIEDKEKELLEAIKTDSVSKYIQISKLLKRDTNTHLLLANAQHPFHLAVEYGALSLVKHMIEVERCDINVQDIDQRTALFVAIENENEDIVKLLLDAKIDVSVKSKYDISSVHVAAGVGNKKILDQVIQMFDAKGMNVAEEDTMGRSALHHAASSGQIEAFHQLSEHNFKMHNKDYYGLTPIDILVSKFQWQILYKNIVSPICTFGQLIELIDPIEIPGNNFPIELDQYHIFSFCSVRLRQDIRNLMHGTMQLTEETEHKIINDIIESGSDQYLQEAIRMRVLTFRTLDSHFNQTHTSFENRNLDINLFNQLVNEEKYDLVKQILVFSQTNLIPFGLQVVIICRKQTNNNNYSANNNNCIRQNDLVELGKFAENMVSKALLHLHNSGNNLQQEWLKQYVEGTFCSTNPDSTNEQPNYGPKFVLPTKPNKLVSILKLVEVADINELHGNPCITDIMDSKWRYVNNQKKCITFKDGVAPKIKFLLHTLAFFVFFVLLAFEVISMNSTINWLDWIISIYAISLFFQEIFEFFLSQNLYFLNIWNVFDIIASAMVLVGMVLKFLLVSYQGRLDDSQLYDIRMVLATSFVLFGMKGLVVLRVHKNWGPLINMMKTLFWEDLIPFLISFYALLIVCSGIFFHSLLTPGNNLFLANGTVDSSSWDILFHIYTRPLLLSFGELQLDDHTNCQANDASGCYQRRGNKIYILGFIQIYLIIVNLLLMNLLIAKFSLTVSRKDEAAFFVWRKYRYLCLKEHLNINTIPPPFNLIEFLVRFIFCVINKTCTVSVKCYHAICHITDTEMTSLFIVEKCIQYQNFLKFQAMSFRHNRQKFIN